MRDGWEIYIHMYVPSNLRDNLVTKGTRSSLLLCKTNCSTAGEVKDCTYLCNNIRFPGDKTFAIICYFFLIAKLMSLSQHISSLLLLLVSCSRIDKMQMNKSLTSTGYESLRQFRTLSNPGPITLCD